MLAAAFVGLAGAVGGTPHENWDVPGAQAQKGIELLREHTPGSANASARVAVHTRDGSPVGATTIAPHRAAGHDGPRRRGLSPERPAFGMFRTFGLSW